MRAISTARLILEQPADQLRAGVFPALVILAPREQQLGLEPQQPAGHFEVIRRLIEAEIVHHGQKLVGHSRNRDVRDIDLLLAEQMQQQVERTREALQLHDEPGTGRVSRSGPRSSRQCFGERFGARERRQGGGRIGLRLGGIPRGRRHD
jgi:hypothetical protein